MHNALVKVILEVFLPRFVEDPRTLYVGDTREKMLYVNEPLRVKLGIELGLIVPQGLCQLADDVLRGLDLAAFDAREIGVIDAGLLAQGLDPHTRIFTNLPC